MGKLTISAAVSGSYRRGGLDLSNGDAIEVDAKDLTAEQMKALKADPRVTIKEPKASKKSKAGNKSKATADERKRLGLNG